MNKHELKTYIKSMIRYELTHRDAGDAYSHLATEGSWTYHNGRERLAKFLEANLAETFAPYARNADVLDACEDFALSTSEMYRANDKTFPNCTHCAPVWKPSKMFYVDEIFSAELFIEVDATPEQTQSVLDAGRNDTVLYSCAASKSQPGSVVYYVGEYVPMWYNGLPCNKLLAFARLAVRDQKKTEKADKR